MEKMNNSSTTINDLIKTLPVPEVAKGAFDTVASDLIERLFNGVSLDVDALSPLEKRIYERQSYEYGEQRNPRGRPTQIVVFEDGEWFTKTEFEVAQKTLQKTIMDTPLRRAGAILTDEEFKDLSRLALPELKLHVIRLAMLSDNVKDVLAVVNSLEDRVMGRPTQAVALVDPNKDIRRGWVLEAESDDE